MRFHFIAAIATVGFLLGCSGARDIPYQFESKPSVILGTGGAASSQSPQVGMSPSGALYVLGLYGDGTNQNLGLAISHNGGDTFQAPVQVAQASSLIRAIGESSPSLGVTSTAIYALWEQASTTGGSDLLFAREPSSGQPFQKPIQVVTKAQPSFNGFSSLSIAPNGDVFVVWLDGRSPGEMHGTFSVYLARSTDRGVSFGPGVEVASGSCPCCRPRIVFGEKGEMYVFWRKVFHGQIRDMVASVSSDNGATFAAPVRVAEDNWKINGCPESGPVAAVLGQRVYVAWMTETEKEMAGVKLSWTDDGGKSFAPAVLASQGVYDANHPSLSVADDTHVVLAFQGRDPQRGEEWSPLQPYVVEINKSGNVSKPLGLPSGAQSVAYPVVTTGTEGRVFLAWTGSEEERNKILLLRGRKVY